MYLSPYAKAVAAFIVTMAGYLISAMQEDTAGGSRIVGNEWLYAFLITIVTTGAVWGTPNKDRRGTKQAESTQPPQM